MAVTAWLIDKSALVRLSASKDAELWADRIGRGLIRISTVTLLEIGFSARSGPDLRQAAQRPPLSLMPVECLTPAAEGRAVEIQMILADQGLHRAPSVPDLLVAAVAEQSGLTVLHLDKDFDLIAEVTGQPVERPRSDWTHGEDELLLLADAQTSGGLLIAGEVPGYPVVGELLPPRDDGVTLAVR
jgi:predicted nucleic acid-binding protein